MFNREIFGPYHNGQSPVYADPVAVYRKLHYALDGVPADYISDSKAEDVQVSYPAKEKLLAATRFAFGLQEFNPVDASGTQDDDCWRLLNVFLDWVNKKKVKEENLQS